MTLRILYMSGYAEDPQLAHASASLLQKPFDPTELMRRIRGLLAHTS